MDKIELVLDSFKGKNEEHPLFSLWKHFPYADRDPVNLAEAHVSFYERHQFDLMKISPHGRFPVVDFGCKIAEKYDPFTGSTNCEECSVKTIQDWETIEQLDVGEGELGKQLSTIELINKELEELPKMMTVFSPLMVASKMDNNLEANLRNNPEVMKESFFILLDIVTEFALASVDAGVEGIFLASQHFRKTKLHWEEVERFEIAFLKKFLSRIKTKSSFTVLHVHGQDIQFDKAAQELDADALNWHDQLTWPTIEEALEIFPKGLLAGIDETKTLIEGKEEKIKKNITEAYELSKRNNNRIMIAPGCVIPITASEESINIISSTMKDLRKRD